MPDLLDALPRLHAVYRELPPVPCRACGQCCVTPHITVVEFADLLDGFLRDHREEELIRLVGGGMIPSERFAGNFGCPLFGENKRCVLHERRGLACRLEGIPVLDRMSVRTEPICPHGAGRDLGGVTEERVNAWIDAVCDLAGEFHRLNEEPYWVNALNIQCWFSVALDPAFTQPYFLDLRRQLRAAFALDFLEPQYADVTRFAEKIRLIDAFYEANAATRAEEAKEIMRRVRDEFPQTGSHYAGQAQAYYRLMEHILDQQGGAS